MKTIFAFCLGALGCVYLRDPDQILSIEKISIGFERGVHTAHKNNKEKKIIEDSKKADRMKPRKRQTVEQWREAQDRATDKLLDR